MVVTVDLEVPVAKSSDTDPELWELVIFHYRYRFQNFRIISVMFFSVMVFVR